MARIKVTLSRTFHDQESFDHFDALQKAHPNAYENAWDRTDEPAEAEVSGDTAGGEADEAKAEAA